MEDMEDKEKGELEPVPESESQEIESQDTELQESEQNELETPQSSDEPVMDEPANGDDEQLSEKELAEIAAKFDSDASMRHYSGVPRQIIRYLCVAFTLYVVLINTFAFHLVVPQVRNMSFIGLIVLYTFLLYPSRKKNNTRVNYVPWYDLVIAFVGLACFFFYVYHFNDTLSRGHWFLPDIFLYVSVVGILILFYASYRVVGIPLMAVVAAFIVYAYLGHLIPGDFGHRGFSTEQIFINLFYGSDGIQGTPINVTSTFIFMFMLFGAFLDKTGIGGFFIELANAIAGKATGGPAKVAVIASALQATISGSSVANTVASGAFTIPMMKRMGYNKNFAGAVEASASTGGQLMPPILGAAAFLMAEITGIPYGQIALAALIPALLYFIGVFAAVHFEAKKAKLAGLPADEIPRAWPLIKRKGHLFLGVISIIFFLARGFTPARSALFGTLVAIAVCMVRKETRLTPTKFIDALENGARSTVGIGIACALAGMVIGVVVLTGLGPTFANSMVTLAGGIGNDYLRLITVLFFTMIASLILGMGVPTTAKYVIMATITAPILTTDPPLGLGLGIPLLVAHMFVFFFGTDADITPPAGLASYAAAAISGGSPLRTSVIAMRLAVAAYIIPFIFVFSPEMLFLDADGVNIMQFTLDNTIKMAQLIVTGVIGITAVAAALGGYFIGLARWWERILLGAAGLLLVDPNRMTDIIGIVLIVLIIAEQKLRIKRGKLVD